MTRVVLKTGAWEPAQTALIRRLLKPGDTFVDVGTNVGWYTVFASDVVGAGGRVYAFEPDPTSGALPRRNVARNRCRNVVVEGKALSDRRGTLTLYLNAENRGNHSVILGNLQDAEGGAIEVEAVSLDEYLGERPGEIALVKIDTEGAEGIILEGMRETMARHPRMAIILEFNPHFIRRAGLDAEAMLRRFHDAGHTIQNINEASGRVEPVAGGRIADFVRSVPYYTNVLVHRPAD
jgi:FkbM family methyltransferase